MQTSMVDGGAEWGRQVMRPGCADHIASSQDSRPTMGKSMKQISTDLRARVLTTSPPLSDLGEVQRQDDPAWDGTRWDDMGPRGIRRLWLSELTTSPPRRAAANQSEPTKNEARTSRAGYVPHRLHLAFQARDDTGWRCPRKVLWPGKLTPSHPFRTAAQRCPTTRKSLETYARFLGPGMPRDLPHRLHLGFHAICRGRMA